MILCYNLHKCEKYKKYEKHSGGGTVARRRVISTAKYEIVQTAGELFFNRGVSGTSPQLLAKTLNMSTGSISYYFPSKEHLLAVFVEMLCDFQWKLMEKEADEGYSSVMAICLELAAMASMCEEDEVAKDFYHSAYTSDLCLEIIQASDIRRAKMVFAEYCPDWSDERFAEAETIVSGVEYTTLKTTSVSPTLDMRIHGALETILTVYQVPEELRRKKIDRVLEMDYRAIGRRVLKEFMDYIQKTNEEAFENLISQIRGETV